MHCPEPVIVKDYGDDWALWYCLRCMRTVRTLSPSGMIKRGNAACRLNIPCRSGLGDKIANALYRCGISNKNYMTWKCFLVHSWDHTLECKACGCKARQSWFNNLGWKCDKACQRLKYKVCESVADAIYGFVRVVDAVIGV